MKESLRSVIFLIGFFKIDLPQSAGMLKHSAWRMGQNLEVGMRNVETESIAQSAESGAHGE